MGNFLEKIKKMKNGFKKFLDFIIDKVKFFMTQIGMIVAIFIIIVFFIIALAVLIRTAEHALGQWLDADYAGISTEGDYEYLVSSLGYAGYDSLITEKVWQEFMAYEYAVLMDVAEYLYQGQEEYYGDPNNTKDAYGPFSQNYYNDSDETDLRDREKGGRSDEKIAGPAYLPYLEVKGEYDISKMSFKDWQKCVIEGQGSARFGITSVGQLTESPGIENGKVSYGGNRDVVPPMIMYEFKMNPYEPDAQGSLVPYITVLKEQLKYYYFTIGGREEFKNGPLNDKNGGVVIDTNNIDLIDLMEISTLLNIGNGYLPKAKAVTNYITQNPGADPRSNSDAWPVADSAFEQQLYYTNDYSSVVYKTALEIIINRYLPKASILTAWYYVKDTDLADPETQGRETLDNGEYNKFNIDDLMRDIKAIYNYYCWENAGETYEDEDIKAILYDSGDGTVVREDGLGSPAKRYDSTQKVATSNKDTFIHFGQAGLETNKFGVFNVYEPKGSKGKPKAPEAITQDPEEATVPVVTDLVSKHAYFMDRFGLDATYEYTYSYRYKEEIPPETTPATYVQGIPIKKPTVPAGHTCNFGSKGGYIRIPGTACTSCASKFDDYEGWKICGKGKTSAGVTVYLVQDLRNVTGPLTEVSASLYITEKGVSDWIYDTAQDSDDIVIPYEATKDIEPRGKIGIDENDKISKYINEKVVKKAEVDFVENTKAIKDAGEYTIEHQDKKFVNYMHLYPELTETPEGGPADAVAASVLQGNIFDYKHELPFYDAGAQSGDPSLTPEKVLELFSGEISDESKGLSGTSTTGDTEFFGLFSDFVNSNSENPDPKPDEPSGVVEYEFLGIDSIDSLDVKGFADNKQDPKYNVPKFTSVSSQSSPFNAIYAIDEYQLALMLDIKQKRISTMIVMDVETWAKSATYDIEIIQNSFDYTNYRYVVPHSYFSFGVRVFKIDEKPLYRVEYYKDYFSKYENSEPGIKEADVLSMMMKWEEFAKSGNDTAYAFMRDLYKLIMYIRQKGIDEDNIDDYILSTAYSYLYVPDTIWEFREGISQEAFWTERLAAEMYGDDAMSKEELKKVLVKKEEIAWQILDYDEYEECQYEEDGEAKTKIYALFPFGAPYTRTWFMEDALEKGVFYDGNYTDGHGGADWTSRAKMSAMLSGKDELAKRIYDYELRSRTLRNIMNGTEKYEDKIEKALDFIEGGTGGTAYTKAESELRAELREYEIRSPEVAVAGGVVYKADYNCYSGFAVGVDHTKDDASTPARTSYVHMRRWPVVQTGDIVGPGTILGYEGTTGNSGGNHLHQNVWVGNAKDSPAEYMGPIFAPFYNQEKVFEISQELSKYSDNEELILGTDYYTLIRTVLMQEFENGKAKYSAEIAPEGQATYLKSASFVMLEGNDGETHEYIDFYGASTTFDELGNPVGGATGVVSGDKIIVKVGITSPEYYLCGYKTEVIRNATASDDSLSGDDFASSNGVTLLRVISKEKIDDFSEEVLANSIQVETDVDITSSTRVIWGNNVPFSPIVADMEDAIDITSLNVEKSFKASEHKSEYDGKPNDPPKKEEGYDDVKATKDFFDAGKVEDRLKVPALYLIHMSDLESEYSIPFYEGPVSVEHQNSGIVLGYSGSISGDLLKFQQALISNGLDPDRTITPNGVFDENTKNIIKQNVTSMVSSTSINNGAVGEYPGHSIEGMVRWNATVTWGSVDESIKVGREATMQAGMMVPNVTSSFVAGVASCESSFIPTNESNQFCGGADAVSWLTQPVFPDETSTADTGNITIVYRGVKRTIRRAQGLMQLAPGVGFPRARAKVGDDIDQIVSQVRTPATNAILGAEYLSENIVSLIGNETHFNRLKELVNSNPAFAAMTADCGISGMELALSGCSAYMYNKGPGNGNTERIIEAMGTIMYDPVEKQAYYPGLAPGAKDEEHGYSHKVITFMVRNGPKMDK
ncbi:MAG: M23 family metallopeptidase [Clostridia bacterium]|nr:M23 family metallopeptidase [Clostridia bacterium]